MGWLIFDGISVLYVLTLCILMIIIMGIFAQRQILRLRNNSARQRPNVSLQPPFSKWLCLTIDQKLESVLAVRKSYQPRLTDCTTIGQHSQAPYVHRMIAVDEITLEIDVQLERIDCSLARQPGETTLAYLMRIRQNITSLPLVLIQRIAFLHEAARFRSQKFDIQHLMELRSLFNQFVKIIGESHTSVNVNQPLPFKGIVSSFYQLGQKVNPTSSRRRRSKFGGSDGGRLLAGSVQEEQVALLPITCETPPCLRRQSESQRSLLS